MANTHILQKPQLMFKTNIFQFGEFYKYSSPSFIAGDPYHEAA